MADKGWTSRVATAAGAAAGTGAAQLGLGYGLGVVVWPVAATTDDSDWLGSLGWATWITASATVFGAVLASRLGGGPAARLSGAWRLALATSAGVGALVAVALIALPARSAVRDDAFSPQVTAGGYALLGVVLGVVVAYWAVVSRPVAANLMATGVLLWALAITAIVVELAWQRDSATYLTSWQFAQVSEGERFGTIFWPSALLTLAAAFLIGAMAVIPAVRGRNFGVGAAVSGVVGPLLVAVAFLALAPRLTGSLGPLESAYLIAPYAVLAGLAGSSLAVTFGRAAAERQSRQAAVDAAEVTAQPRSASVAADKADDSGQSGVPSPDRSASEQGDGVFGRPTASGVAAMPAADPATLPTSVSPLIEPDAASHAQPPAERDEDEPSAPRQRGRFARLIGRAKIPSQPTDASLAAVGSGSGSGSSPGAPTSTTSARPSPASATGESSSTASTDADATPRPSTSDATTDAPRTRRSSSDPKKSPFPASSPASSSDKAGESGVARGALRSKSAAGEPAEGADPEIAAAARPNRERARKATTSGPRPAKSTVTPPPSEPTIAQINPQPPSGT